MTDDATTAAGATGTLGYEQARDELIEVVRRLEAGGTTLEESLALWERGEELAKVCRLLAGGRARPAGRGTGRSGRLPGERRRHDGSDGDGNGNGRQRLRPTGTPGSPRGPRDHCGLRGPRDHGAVR